VTKLDFVTSARRNEANEHTSPQNIEVSLAASPFIGLACCLSPRVRLRTPAFESIAVGQYIRSVRWPVRPGDESCRGSECRSAFGVAVAVIYSTHGYRGVDDERTLSTRCAAMRRMARY
jgi:hypothetical protein